MPVSELTMGDAYDRTLKRTRNLQDAGYTVEEFWSCDVKRTLRENAEIRDFCAGLKIYNPLDAREGFYGGRTNAVTLYYKAKPGEEIHYKDFCSLYPYVNKYCRYPIGIPEIVTEEFESLETRPYYGMIKCRVLPPRGLLHPVLPYRSGGKLTFPLCATCANGRLPPPCNHTDEERTVRTLSSCPHLPSCFPLCLLFCCATNPRTS